MQKNISDSLAKEVTRLRLELENSNSMMNKFIGGIITGFGTVIGATLVVALFAYILSSLSNIEAIRPLIESVVKIVRESNK
jgi:Domain of unknown function (DUF5665)